MATADNDYVDIFLFLIAVTAALVASGLVRMVAVLGGSQIQLAF